MTDESEGTTLTAPFPWFGGKSRVAPLVWQRFGDVANYVEPFFGSGAVLLGAPTADRIETVNDLDGYVANFWRAVRRDPEAVAEYADHPVNELDLHARHTWLLAQRDEFVARLGGDPEYFNAKIAGWWCWGVCCWIGGGWCSGQGPWQSVEGRLVRVEGGRGVNRKLPHLGDAGRGVNRRRPHLSDAGQGVNGQRDVRAWMQSLAARLARVRVCCGDWSRVCGPSVTLKHGLTAVLLDPPYSDAATRRERLYRVDSLSVARDVRAWCLENGDNPLLRIALCGYEGEHDMPASWECVEWKAQGGYGSRGNGAGRDNARRERIWFSPHCLRPRQERRLFA